MTAEQLAQFIRTHHIPAWVKGNTLVTVHSQEVARLLV